MQLDGAGSDPGQPPAVQCHHCAVKRFRVPRNLSEWVGHVVRVVGEQLQWDGFGAHPRRHGQQCERARVVGLELVEEERPDRVGVVISLAVGSRLRRLVGQQAHEVVRAHAGVGEQGCRRIDGQRQIPECGSDLGGLVDGQVGSSGAEQGDGLGSRERFHGVRAA